MSQDHPGDGNDRQDPEIAAMLSRIRPPEHGDDFWATLRTELQAAASGNDVPEEPGGHGTGDHTVVPMHPTTGNGRGPGGDRRRLMMLAAAAVVIVALIGGGYLALRDEETSVITPPDPDPTLPTPPDTDSTTPTITEDSADTTLPGALPSPQGDPISRGSGRALAVDDTSSFVYIADAAPEAGQGCEGAPRAALYVEPIDGGERKLIADADTIDVTTGAKIRFDGQGGVALVSQCEGFGATVYTSTIQPDGTFGEITELTIPDVDLDQPVSSILDIEFREPGTLVAATYTMADDGDAHRHLYEFPVGPSEVTDLGMDGAVAVDMDGRGRLVVLDAEGNVRFDRSTGYSTQSMTDIAVTPSGDRVVQTGMDRTEVNGPDGSNGEGISLPGLAISYLNETTAVIERWDDGATSAAVAVDITDLGALEAEMELIDGSTGLGFAVAPDLSRVFASQASADGSTFTFVEQRLTR